MRRYCNLCGCEQDFETYTDNSHAELRGNSHAELRGNSHALLWGNSHAELWDNSHAQCKSPYACAILKSQYSKCFGRSIGSEPIPAVDYLESCGVEIKRGFAILFKSTMPDGSSNYNPSIKYIIGKKTIAPDWDVNYAGECGRGLHVSPSVQQAVDFHDSGCYFACRVNIKDIANLPAYASMPGKIRVRACTPLYKVDKDGNKKL